MSIQDNATTTSSITTTYKTSRALPTALLQNLIKPFGNLLVRPGDALPAGSPVLTPDSSVYRHCDVRHSVVEGINIYNATAKEAGVSSSVEQHDGTGRRISMDGMGEQTRRRRKRKSEKQIYYFCGGGWQSPPSKEHWKLCSQLAQTGAEKGFKTTVSVVSYPLAPNSPASVTLPMLERLYYSLLSPNRTSTSSPTAQAQAQAANHGIDAATTTDTATTQPETDIILAGDSSGANIILSLTLSILHKNPHAPAPHALLLLSPPCDLRNTNPGMRALEKHDPVLTIPFVQSTARAWCVGTPDLQHPAIPDNSPLVSPLLADVSVLAERNVEVHGVLGGYDILTPDAVLFREKLEREGVRGKWLEWERQMHCFILAGAGYGLPEGKEAVEWVEEVLFGV